MPVQPAYEQNQMVASYGFLTGIVFIKQVAQIYLHSGVDMRTKEMITEGLVETINPYDEVALERAIQLREEAGAGQVTVVTLGPDKSEQTLRWGLAMGLL